MLEFLLLQRVSEHLAFGHESLRALSILSMVLLPCPAVLLHLVLFPISCLMLSCLWQAKDRVSGAVDGVKFGSVLVYLLCSVRDLIVGPSHFLLLKRVEASGSTFGFVGETNNQMQTLLCFSSLFALPNAGENLECHRSVEGPNPAWQASAEALPADWKAGAGVQSQQ